MKDILRRQPSAISRRHDRHQVPENSPRIVNVSLLSVTQHNGAIERQSWFCTMPIHELADRVSYPRRASILERIFSTAGFACSRSRSLNTLPGFRRFFLAGSFVVFIGGDLHDQRITRISSERNSQQQCLASDFLENGPRKRHALGNR